MLPPFIIEQIRRREQEERVEREQPRLELPLPMSAPRREAVSAIDADDVNRGVIVIDL
jgi:hypothetical protein